MKKIILNAVRKTKNYKKHFALVDDEDYERANKYNWGVKENSHIMYARIKINGKSLYLHNFILGFIGIDHEDGNGLNCQKSNLRKATQQQNNMNRSPNKKITSSKFKGVSWSKANGKWRSGISYNNKTIHLGYFDSEIEAAEAYNEKAKELFKEFAKLNELKNNSYFILSYSA